MREVMAGVVKEVVAEEVDSDASEEMSSLPGNW
jgi:hypothetical protein